MASEIHMFRQSSMKAGNLGKYYINPSEKMMNMESEWIALEHEDGIEVIFYRDAFKGNPISGKIYYNQAIGDSENKDDVEYSYIMNTDYLDAKQLKGEISEGYYTVYIPKIKS
ncbi:hypothetical protein C5167_016245 [Papaver somniferum]|uniref:uncharacterized protein LOC113332747 n=1 Tax=Papaver somniferum TaxID=3469 RepID=UPI000E701A02|nr:uncharacterized protein LOC113332747 [Papaver somniferum]RZC88441.1 hypothetical protein C5167_016245 [Papaver somniferum]